MKKIIFILVSLIYFSVNAHSQNVSKFSSERQMYLVKGLESEKIKTDDITVSIDWTNKKIKLDFNDAAFKDLVFPFVSFDSNREDETFTFYFNSKELKVGMLINKPAPGLIIQYKDGGISTIYLSKKL